MKKNTLEKLNSTIFVTKDMFRDISNDNDDTISKNLLRWNESGYIINMKNGLYITKNTYLRDSKLDGFAELIANKLRTPSYVSLEYALSKYGVLTESVYVITSVTLKTKRNFENITGKYIYKSIKKSLFTGYKIEKFLTNEYYIATKEKALFDYLYFKKNTLPNDLENINLVEELRLNLNGFWKKDFRELNKYAKLSKNKKIINIINNITYYASNRV